MKDITWRGIQRRPVGGSQRVLSCRGSQNWCSVVPPREGEAPAEPRVETNGRYSAFFWVGLFHHGKTSSTEKRRGDGRTICGCRPRKGEACGAAWDSLAWQVFGSAGASPSQRGGSGRNARLSDPAAVRLSRSFALPKERGSRRNARSSDLASVRLSGSIALPKGQQPWQCNLELRTGFCADPKYRG